MTYQTGSVTSADGTVIGYRQFGNGPSVPSVLLIHGGMQAAQNFTTLAEALSTSFTVYVHDRRGRGRSGPFGDDYSLAKECADVDALLRQTGARCVFGLSSGALIALYAACKLSGIDKLALYEPPLTSDGSSFKSWLPDYERAVERGDLANAMASVIKGTGDPSVMTRLPRFILAPLIGMAMRADAQRAHGDDVPIAQLIPTLRFDAKLAREAAEDPNRFETLRAKVLLMGGDRSAGFLHRALAALGEKLVHARRVELKGIGHLAADNQGRPGEVATVLRDFFGAM